MKTAIDAILAPTDFSEGAREAAEVAALLAARLDTDLVLLHVRERTDETGDPVVGVPGGVNAETLNASQDHAAVRLLDMAASFRERGLTVEARIAEGHPAEEIGVTASELEIGLVVMGTHGRRGLSRWLLGSVTSEAIRTISCPVLAWPGGQIDPQAETALTRGPTILLATDFSPAAAVAADYALALVSGLGGRVVAFHVIDGPTIAYAADPLITSHPDLAREFGRLRAQRQVQLDRLGAELAQAGVPVETLMAEGLAADEIVKAAEDLSADVLVMGTVGRRGLNRILLGSVADRVLRTAHRPVLTCRVPLNDAQAAEAPADDNEDNDEAPGRETRTEGALT